MKGAVQGRVWGDVVAEHDGLKVVGADDEALLMQKRSIPSELGKGSIKDVLVFLGSNARAIKEKDLKECVCVWAVRFNLYLKHRGGATGEGQSAQIRIQARKGT